MVVAKAGQTCRIHRLARTAKDLHIMKVPNEPGGERCVKCRRFFRAEDLVQKDLVETTKRRVKSYGHQHVICDPPPVHRLTGKKLRESPKPLLADEVLGE